MKVQFFTMCSITTVFTVFAFILPFLLQLCSAGSKDKNPTISSKDIKPPHWMYPQMSISKSPGLAEYLEFNPTSHFRRQCASLYHVNSNNQECLRFCGYVQIGMMDSGANLRSSYVKDKLNLIDGIYRINKKSAYNGVMRCASRGYYDLCAKAKRNADCLFKYVNSDWIDIDLINVLGAGASGGGGGGSFDPSNLPDPGWPSWDFRSDRGDKRSKKH